jgi:Glycosyl transferase family 11
MIVVRLSGGLGNQLFEYAFARYLALKHGADLWIDASFYTSKGLEVGRQFELARFNIFCQRIHYDNRFAEEEFGSLNLGLKYVREDSYAFGASRDKWKQITELGDAIILDGYWAVYNEYLFDEDFKCLLRRELTLKNQLEDQAFSFFKAKIERSEHSVSVHIRRGDYKDLSHIFELCGEAYYNRAFGVIEQTVKTAEYFVFSDEIDWVKNNFKFSRNVEFVKSASAVSDFELMRRCRHNIAANSTFSLWAAYLNENPNKTVVVPEKYFQDKAFQSIYENEALLLPCLRV